MVSAIELQLVPITEVRAGLLRRPLARRYRAGYPCPWVMPRSCAELFSSFEDMSCQGRGEAERMSQTRTSKPGDTGFASTGTHHHVEPSGRLLVSSSYRWSKNERPGGAGYVSRVDELPSS